jgi:hypothetical protein
MTNCSPLWWLRTSGWPTFRLEADPERLPNDRSSHFNALAELGRRGLRNSSIIAMDCVVQAIPPTRNGR